MSFFRSYSMVMGANIFMLVLAILNNKLLYVCLDQEANGVFFLILRFSTLLSFILGDWLRLSNLNIAGKTPGSVHLLLANTVWYSLAVGGLLYLNFRLFSPLLPDSFFGVSSAFIPVVIIGAAGLMMRDSIQAILIGTQRLTYYAITYAVLSVVYFGLDIIFLVVLDLGLNAVITAWIAGVAAGAVWGLAAHRKLPGLQLRPSLEILRESRKIGVRALVAISGMYIMVSAHTFAIEPILGKTGQALVMVAMFSVCYRIYQLFQRFSDVASSLIHSHTAQENSAGSERITAATVRTGVFFSVCASIFSICFGKNVILFIADAEYADAYFPLLAMLPGIIAVSAGSIINGYYWGKGYPLKISLAPFLATIFGLGLGWMLMPKLGLTGTTLSFSAMTVAWMGYVTVIFSRDSGLPLREIFVPRPADFVQIMNRIKLPVRSAQ